MEESTPALSGDPKALYLQGKLDIAGDTDDVSQMLEGGKALASSLVDLHI